MSDVVIITNPPEVVVVEPSDSGGTVEIGETVSGLQLSDVAFTHHQPTPASVWTITHPLSFYPSVSVVDSAGTEVEGAVQHTSLGSIVVSFTGAFSGTAYLS